jgi:site-specific DNA-methyltransferase (adenine-specific)
VDHPTQKPLEIIERMIKASCPHNGVVLDLFMGSGTTAVAAKRCERNFVGFELNPDYCSIIQQRLAGLEAPPPPKRKKLALQE